MLEIRQSMDRTQPGKGAGARGAAKAGGRTGAGHHDLLAAHHHNVLAVEELLRHHRGEAAEQVALAVDHDLLLKHLDKGPKQVEEASPSEPQVSAWDASQQRTRASGRWLPFDVALHSKAQDP